MDPEAERNRQAAVDYLMKKAVDRMNITDMPGPDKDKVMNVLVGEARKLTAAELKRRGVDLDRLENDGYSPFLGNGLGQVVVMPTTDNGAYLLVTKMGEKTGEVRRYVVENGRVDPRVYLKYNDDFDPDKMGWVLVDQRGTQPREMSLVMDRKGEFPKGVRLGDKEITNPYLDIGVTIVTGNRDYLPEGPHLSKFETAWVKKLH